MMPYRGVEIRTRRQKILHLRLWKHRALLVVQGAKILPNALPHEMKQKKGMPATGTLSKAEFEKEQILKALKRTNYNKSKAAKLLQITRKTLYNRISYYDLDV